MVMRVLLLLTLLCLGSAPLAQQYRWIDEQGRLHYSDTPPAKAKALTQTGARTAGQPEEPPLPYALQRLQKDFPVTLYTAPSCDEHCDMARAMLNKRGVPFAEVPVVTAETLAEVKALTGAEIVPVLVVGRNVFKGYEASNYQSLLDSAGYPREGAVPARSQRAPVVPAAAGADAPPVAEPAQGAEAASAKRGRYDPSGLKSNRVDRPGRYAVPDGAN